MTDLAAMEALKEAVAQARHPAEESISFGGLTINAAAQKIEEGLSARGYSIVATPNPAAPSDAVRVVNRCQFRAGPDPRCSLQNGHEGPHRLPAAAPVDVERLAAAMRKVRSNKENIDLDGRFDLGLDEEAAEVAAILNRLAGQSSSQPVGGEG